MNSTFFIYSFPFISILIKKPKMKSIKRIEMISKEISSPNYSWRFKKERIISPPFKYPHLMIPGDLGIRKTLPLFLLNNELIYYMEFLSFPLFT